jgi:hypothetical protein
MENCPVCNKNMRIDNLARHLSSHKDIAKDHMTPERIARIITNKIPIIAIEPPGKDRIFLTCMACKKGRTTFRRKTTMKDYYAEHVDCGKKWDKYKDYYIGDTNEMVDDIPVQRDPRLDERIKELEGDLLEAKEDAKNYEDDCNEAQKESARLEEELYSLQERILYLPDHVLNAEALQNIITEIRTARAEKEQRSKIVRSAGNPVPPQPPPVPPKQVVQNPLPTPEPRNEIRYDFESEDIDDNASDVSCTPMEYWNMKDENIKRLFGSLSDILEQGMSSDDAKDKYSKLLLELRPLQEKIGKPYNVLRAFTKDLYTLRDLDCFLTVYE